MPTSVRNLTIGELSILLAAIAAVFTFLRKALPWMAGVVRFVDDISGQPPRKGKPAQPGLLERQTAVEDAITEIRALAQQLRPNGGGSVKDQLNRMDILASKMTNQLEDLKSFTRSLQQTYDAHAMHSGQVEVELRSALSELQHKAFKE